MRNSESIKTWREEFLESAKSMESTPEALWCSLKSQLHQLTKNFVPIEYPSNKPTWKDCRKPTNTNKTNHTTRSAQRYQEKCDA